MRVCPEPNLLANSQHVVLGSPLLRVFTGVLAPHRKLTDRRRGQHRERRHRCLSTAAGCVLSVSLASA